MLDGTGDTDGNVELGGDNLTGLADLERVVSESTVNGGTGGTDGGTEGVSKGEDDLVKVLLVLKTTATRDDAGGRAKVGALGLGQVLRDPLRDSGGLGVGSVLNGSGTRASGGSVKGRRTDGDELDGIRGLDGLESVAGVDGADKGVLGLDLDDVANGLDVEGSTDTGENVLAESRAGGEDVGEGAGLDVLGNEVGKRLSEALYSVSNWLGYLCLGY